MRRGSRSAFTFLELILVLTIIVALAGISWPRLSGLLKRESVLGNVEQVRQVLDHARVQAVEDGITYQFRYEPNGRKYVLLPHELLISTAPQAGTPASAGTLPDGIKLAQVHELSADCYFYTPPLLAGDPVITERLAEPWLAMVNDGITHRDVSWSAPILYSPDGSATSAAVTVADQERRYLTLSVRGLTGTVVTSRISQLSETFGAVGE